MAQLPESFGWLPPSRNKTRRQYPFSAIWGNAFELLSTAEKIRVIGASLLPGDWHVVELLFESTFLGPNATKPPTLELINRPETAERIATDYPLLEFVPIHRIDEVVRFARDSNQSEFAKCRGTADPIAWDDTIMDADFDSTKNKNIVAALHKNPVDYWLQAKIAKIVHSGEKVMTESGKLEQYYRNTDGVA